jgi:hypothetical protein
MDEFCMFRLELSKQNDNPDVPNYTPNVEKLQSVSEMLPIKYERYKTEQSIQLPLQILISSSPISTSPLLYKINTYFKNKNKIEK